MNFIGKVIHGDGRGMQIGSPTINLEGDFSQIEHGVYAVWVNLGAARYKGAMNYGAQPTFDSEKVRVEIFLLDFEGDLYGETVTVEVVQKIRDVKKFAGEEELKLQIARDVLEIKNILCGFRGDVYK